MATMVFEFCKIAIALVFAIGFVGIVPVIKKYVDSVIDEKQQEKIKQWALDVVDWANDALESEDGYEKLNAGKKIMRDICDEFNIQITNEQIDILLRAGYQQMLRLEIEEVFEYDDLDELDELNEEV